MQLNFDLKRFVKETVDEELKQQLDENQATEESREMFVAQSANSWLLIAKNRKIPRMLFDVFWHEGELCILYADTNLGKSFLAVQIADSISRGVPIKGASDFEFKLGAEKQKVIYFDFELSDKQFEKRYSKEYKEHYEFDENLIRIEFNPNMDIPKGVDYNDYLLESIEKSIHETGAKVLIIDNLTYMREDNERAKDALPLMKELKRISKTLDVSMLIIAHTPKRDHYKPLSKNDLAGSKMLINFCDSSFVIGESFREIGVRYLKQIKQRNTECIYHTEKVCLCLIKKPHNFVFFEQFGFGSEREHLKVKRSAKEEEELIAEVMNLEKQNLSYREIAAKLSIHHMKVGRIVKKHKDK